MEEVVYTQREDGSIEKRGGGEDRIGLTPAAVGALVNGDLENFLVASTLGGIEAQEAQGQRDMVASSRLPIGMNRAGHLSDSRVKIESLGIKIVEKADDLFYKVILPDGWELKPTDHSMWSYLHDSNGNKRAGIFYKAAFYDRSAHIDFLTRFFENTVYCGADGMEVEKYEDAVYYRRVVVDRMKGEDVIFRTDTALKGDFKADSDNGVIARKWMDDNYPDWRSPEAYWD